jgi:hypothetical protein
MTDINVSPEDVAVIRTLKQEYMVVSAEYGDWIGKPMMNPTRKIGLVISDSNGWSRLLEVKFLDKTTETLVLSNSGKHPKESQRWKWLYEHGGVCKWVEWGEM